ncbi:DUF1223 domain-containing protein [Marinobacter algicola]|uniref:DUF1223 domain-containing protein n=1 Tax=Marinobacter algicola TaxID=236100 RepID=UPI003BA98B5C
MTKWFIALLLMSPWLANAAEWSSGTSKTDVVELFTSEGCSSCPPADRWLSSLKSNPEVFKEFVPMAFHVDYWDYIGWKDPFAKPAYSERQRNYVREGHVSQSYTPGIVINNKEWRQWFRGQRTWKDDTQQVGVLKASVNDKRHFKAEFDGDKAGQLHIAILGMGLTTSVKAGENRGSELSHDFVVLKLITVPGEKSWTVPLPEFPEKGQKQNAIAAWVTPYNSQTILQAVGGYID